MFPSERPPVFSSFIARLEVESHEFEMDRQNITLVEVGYCNCSFPLFNVHPILPRKA